MKSATTRAFGLLMMMLTLSFAGCDSASETDNDTPPVLLSAEAFSMQTDLFDTPTNEAAPKAGINFAAAAFRVWPVSLILNANLAIPVLITAASLQEDPVFEDGQWTWTATTQDNGNTFSFALSGSLSASGVSWSMKVSSSQPVFGQSYDNFEVYTATSALDGKSGSWKLYYKNNGVSQNVLNADFEMIGETEKNLTFSIPESMPKNGGDSVRYEVNDSERRFFWQQIAEGFSHDVRWDAVANEGSIVATNFNNGTPACWDTTLENTTCP